MQDDIQRNTNVVKDTPTNTYPSSTMSFLASKRKAKARKSKAQQSEKLWALSCKVGISSLDDNDSSSLSDSGLGAILPLSAPDPINAAPMLIQQWMHQSGTLRKKSPKPPQQKPGSHNKQEMVDPPLSSLSAPYPMGTKIFPPGTGMGKHKASAQEDSGGTGEDSDIMSPPRKVGK